MAPTLDEEIEALRARVSLLKDQLRIQTSTLLAAPSTRRLLPPVPTNALLPPDSNPFSAAAAAAAAAEEPSPAPPTKRRGRPSKGSKLAAAAAKGDPLSVQAALQRAHNQQCLYRACAGITTFRVADPDPRAVDAGAVLGLRVEVVSRARFLRPYYVLLNRPHANADADAAATTADNATNNAAAATAANPYKSLLRVHRHTIPPCVPLAALAARHLPQPKRAGGGGGGRNSADAAASGNGAGRQEDEGETAAAVAVPKQDLAKFARALRRELVRYHNRLGVVADLRKAAGLDEKDRAEKKKKKEKKRKRKSSSSSRLADARGQDGRRNGEEADEEDEGDDGEDNDDDADGSQDEAGDESEGEGEGESSRESSTAGRARLVDVVQIDVEARQIRLDWADGRTGRLVVGDGGEVARLVAFDGRGARDRDAVRELLGGAVRVDELAKKLVAARGGSE